MVVIDREVSPSTTKVSLAIDSGVNKTLLSEKAWLSVKPQPGHQKPRLKKNRTNFTPFGASYKVPILRRTKCLLTAPQSKSTNTIIYVVSEESQRCRGTGYHPNQSSWKLHDQTAFNRQQGE